MPFYVEGRRPGEKWCRIGSDDGHETLDIASFWMHYGAKTMTDGAIRVVDEKGEQLMAIAVDETAP